MRVLAVCGYKRHGKDSFVSDLLSVARGNAPSYAWAVFSRREARPLAVCPKATHVSFAARIKTQVHHALGLPDGYEPADKDAPMLSRQTSFRDLYKRAAAEMTTANPRHWADAALDNVPPDTTQVLVSDFRFPAELEAMRQVDADMLTARVFYAHAAIPDTLDSTERSLDSLTTDFLALPLDALHLHREAVMDALPQYRCFVFHMTIC